jgi:hypothetical protein
MAARRRNYPGAEIYLEVKFRRPELQFCGFEGLSGEKNLGEPGKDLPRNMVTKGKLPEKRLAAKKAKSPVRGFLHH